MRKHAVRALTIVAAGAALTGIALPAFAWTHVGTYPSKFKCVDAGQTYQREGWDYSCRTRPAGDWLLFIQ
ncbi:hypothetical protein ACIA49_05200 [Kribbella sp. NPDC051587]|jgi:hypothetical protein|uniref:hypothetical protein n=1 Tax=Kribbella sp. NPDC051587 TaxID=3364119 RepID=UPI0037B751AC